MASKKTITSHGRLMALALYIGLPRVMEFHHQPDIEVWDPRGIKSVLKFAMVFTGFLRSGRTG